MQASDCCLAIESFGVAIRLDWVNRGKTDDSDGGIRARSKSAVPIKKR